MRILLCGRRPGGRPPGQGGWRFCLPDGNKKRLNPGVFGSRHGDRMRAGPRHTVYADALAFPPEAPPYRGILRNSGAISNHDKGTPPRPRGQSRSPSRRAPARPADPSRRRAETTLGSVRAPPQWPVTQDGVTATRRSVAGPRTAPYAPIRSTSGIVRSAVQFAVYSARYTNRTVIRSSSERASSTWISDS
jgi:hypothetical protein